MKYKRLKLKSYFNFISNINSIDFYMTFVNK